MGRDIDDEKPVQKIEQAQPQAEKHEPLNLLDLTQAGSDQGLAKTGDKVTEVPTAVQEFVAGLGDNVSKCMQKIKGANNDDLDHWKRGIQDAFDYMSKPDSKYCGGGAGLSPEQLQQLNKALG